MQRIFHSIGQGAFYTEEFDNFTVVYDCGSSTDKQLLKQRIKSKFKQDQIIDAVFISHFHADHVNGLNFLLDYCNVKRIFLPLLSNEEKLQLTVYNYIHNATDQYLKLLITNPSEVITPETSIIFIASSGIENEENYLRDYDLDEIDIDSLTGEYRTIEGNIRFTSQNLNGWGFIPFNFQRTEKLVELQNKLTKHSISINSINDFEKLWSDSISKQIILNEYKSISGGLNSNSMTLYSGPLNSNIAKRAYGILELKHYPQFPHLLLEHYSSGCLYFGDYNAKKNENWNQLFNHYKEYWNNIGIVQIPHHGSFHNYSRKINNINPMLSIISAGKSNRYRHPHASTIRNIFVDGGWPIIVNEEITSQTLFKVYITQNELSD